MLVVGSARLQITGHCDSIRYSWRRFDLRRPFESAVKYDLRSLSSENKTSPYQLHTTWISYVLTLSNRACQSEPITHLLQRI